MNKVYVLGMGPGSREYILPVTVRIIRSCDILIGGQRNLQYFQNLGKETHCIKADLRGIMEYVQEKRKYKKIAFLLSGDTGFYSMLEYIKKYISIKDLEIIPGISSFQYLMARIGESWQDAFVGSLHGREWDFVEAVQSYGKAVFLTDHKYTPQQMAKKLVDHGMEDKIMIVGENLSYENEKIIRGTPKEIMDMPSFDMAVVVIKDEKDLLEL
ncbi:precorrin-6y C5,15-methyltransferase (decarboxylating) subunit CbiE [Thermotalea metallivorans]|uniref:Cobalt-precorrin-7 C(5)-methyltransferase n=1 Tax=Thermotalea metallivorans TaxID=520762 RepID=A0A140LED7_9FIRM|nr:precorrin-6y C5,15-methyltransferase (decarboxylating) subunit CbiE [Thermotalea metallivorans]KXG78912.1 Cobalt-precorrin-7 C(5)-methyltransferase [Thermotalea metallivorans]